MMYAGAMHIDLNDPWLQERSRAMHADLDATQDSDAQAAIMRRHVDAALSSRGVAADDHGGFNDMLRDLFHAAGPEQPHDVRMLVGMWLMYPLDPPPETP
jgi:tRNA C32,U32 (ribose-2'-O)-methylase TrmJ